MVLPYVSFLGMVILGNSGTFLNLKYLSISLYVSPTVENMKEIYNTAVQSFKVHDVPRLISPIMQLEDHTHCLGFRKKMPFMTERELWSLPSVSLCLLLEERGPIKLYQKSRRRWRETGRFRKTFLCHPLSFGLEAKGSLLSNVQMIKSIFDFFCVCFEPSILKNVWQNGWGDLWLVAAVSTSLCLEVTHSTSASNNIFLFLSVWKVVPLFDGDCLHLKTG